MQNHRKRLQGKERLRCRRKDLVHRLLNPLGSAAVSWLVFKARAKRRYLDHSGRPTQRRKNSRPTRGPQGRVANGSAASLFVSHVSIQICSFLPPCRRPILNATEPKGFRRRCTSSNVLPILQHFIEVHIESSRSRLFVDRYGTSSRIFLQSDDYGSADRAKRRPH